MVINESNIMWRDSNGFIRKWVDQKTGDIMEAEDSVIDGAVSKIKILNIAEGVVSATQEEYLQAWQYLIDTGMAWSLQGWFSRTAKALIEKGLIMEHECEDFVSMCCGAERNEYIEYFCGACNEGAGFECAECSMAEKD